MSDQGPYAEFEGPILGPPRRNGHHGFTDRMDTRIAMAWSRASIFIIGFLVTVVIIPGGIWFVNHMIEIQDRQDRAVQQLNLKFTELNQQTLNIVSAQLMNSKNMQDRIEAGETRSNDRINAISEWMRQTSAKIDDLAKMVYQNIKVR